MKSRLIALLVLLSLVAGAQLPGQRITLGDGLKAAALRSDEIRLYSLLSADVNSLDDLLVRDCLYIHSSGKIQTKGELLADLKSGAMKYLRLQYTTPPAIRLFNGDTAVITGTMQLEVESKAAGEVKRTLVTTAVYVLQSERWQLASYHSANAAP